VADAQKHSFVDETFDKAMMTRALDLAARATGKVSPNPMVGCVLVRDSEIIGEGWHQGPGSLHAETAALADTDDARGAIAYVTLEPCNHTGLTGPCAQALIDAGVSEVIYAIDDPNNIAAGGSATLNAAGINTRSGVCAAQARSLNRFWLHALNSPRPYVVAKMAMSLDGKIATAAGDSKWITGIKARRRAHDLRRSVDAIVAGAQTIIADDPSLTARDEQGLILDDAYQPQRIVFDGKGRTSPNAKVFTHAVKAPMLATLNGLPVATYEAFQNTGVDCVTVDSDGHGNPDPHHFLKELRNRNVQSVLVEGGGKLIGSFLKADLIDEVWAFIALHKIIGGDGRPAIGDLALDQINDAYKLDNITTEVCGDDLLVRGKISRKDAT